MQDDYLTQELRMYHGIFTILANASVKIALIIAGIVLFSRAVDGMMHHPCPDPTAHVVQAE